MFLYPTELFLSLRKISTCITVQPEHCWKAIPAVGSPSPHTPQGRAVSRGTAHPQHTQRNGSAGTALHTAEIPQHEHGTQRAHAQRSSPSVAVQRSGTAARRGALYERHGKSCCDLTEVLLGGSSSAPLRSAPSAQRWEGARQLFSVCSSHKPNEIILQISHRTTAPACFAGPQGRTRRGAALPRTSAG